jgi:hypothetical protein
MRKPFPDPKTFSRRRFMIGSAAAAMLASTDTRAADIRYRLGLSQPARFKMVRTASRLRLIVVALAPPASRTCTKGSNV